MVMSIPTQHQAAPGSLQTITNNNSSQRYVIRRKELLSRTGLSDVTIWRLEHQGQFPRRVQLGGNSIGWLSHEVDAWFDQKARERYDDRPRGRKFLRTKINHKEQGNL